MVHFACGHGTDSLSHEIVNLLRLGYSLGCKFIFCVGVAGPCLIPYVRVCVLF